MALDNGEENHVKSAPSKISLPDNLEELVLSQFDALVSRKQLLWESSTPEIFTEDEFQFEVRILPILSQKPIDPPTTSTTQSKPKDPFLHPPDSEIIQQLSLKHNLLLNKFCVYRPMLLVTTVQFEAQSHDLDHEDLDATWTVLKALEKNGSRYVGAFNCGVNAGCSQGHKHLQLFPEPECRSGWRGLWPAGVKNREEITDDIPNVPFKHAVLPIHTPATSKEIFAIYQKLLAETKKMLKEAGEVEDYNVAFTREWMVLIPRRKLEDIDEQPFGANALGMLGLVGLRSEEERGVWQKMGWTRHVTNLGLTRS